MKQHQPQASHCVLFIQQSKISKRVNFYKCIRYFILMKVMVIPIILANNPELVDDVQE
jgi:hypothetical protein